jgi:hypothetical protein
MATMNFSIPEDVKRAFNRTFAGHNKSGIIKALMERAIADEERRARRSAAIARLTDRRPARPMATGETTAVARERLRE